MHPPLLPAPQDDVPPFDSVAARAILEASLGRPVDEVFSELDAEPIAAASLGQVYLGRLKTGERVVVKVQRPGLKELFDIDLKNIRAIAVWLQNVRACVGAGRGGGRGRGEGGGPEVVGVHGWRRAWHRPVRMTCS